MYHWKFQVGWCTIKLAQKNSLFYATSDTQVTVIYENCQVNPLSMDITTPFYRFHKVQKCANKNFPSKDTWILIWPLPIPKVDIRGTIDLVFEIVVCMFVQIFLSSSTVPSVTRKIWGMEPFVFASDSITCHKWRHNCETYREIKLLSDKTYFSTIIHSPIGTALYILAKT